MDIKEARQYANNISEKVRKLELQKAKTEERKKLNDAALADCIEKIKKMGCTPENLQSVIDDRTNKAETIKKKIDEVLSGIENEL